MELILISWMVIVTAGQPVVLDSNQVRIASCNSITRLTGQTIQLVPKRVSSIIDRNHDGDLNYLQCSTSQLVCTMPDILQSTETTGKDLPRTCAELTAHDMPLNGGYVIYPNGNISDPIQVQCQDGVTIISHNVIGEKDVPQGNERPGSYVQEVGYNLPMDIIVSILNNSKSCRQSVRLRCHNTHIYDDGGEHNVYWISRQGYIMPNWGDAPSNVRGCPCGLDQSCYFSVRDISANCNCYRSPDVWLVDEGNLTDVTRLPVIRLHFGDTGGDNENMKYELGFLECE